jgi:hypothetical protein
LIIIDHLSFDTTDFMSVVFQFQPTEPPYHGFTRLRMTIELYRSRSVRKRVNFYGAAGRLKLKYHRHEVGGIK